MQRIKTKIGDLLATGNKEPWPVVCTQLDRLLRGWPAYFGYAQPNQRPENASNVGLWRLGVCDCDGPKFGPAERDVPLRGADTLFSVTTCQLSGSWAAASVSRDLLQFCNKRR